LQIPFVKSQRSVNEGLAEFFGLERLDGFQRFCSACDKMTPVDAQPVLLQAPHVLTLQLKRFSVPSQGRLCKQFDKVSCPSIVYVNVETSERPELLKYELRGIVEHHGRDLSTGHCTTDIYKSDGEVHNFDDSHVSVLVSKELATDAYVITYEKVDPLIWSPTTHSKFPAPYRQCLYTLLLLQHRPSCLMSKISLSVMVEFLFPMMPCDWFERTVRDQSKLVAEQVEGMGMVDTKGDADHDAKLGEQASFSTGEPLRHQAAEKKADPEAKPDCLYQKLDNLVKHLEAGYITREEFETAKKKLGLF
jgi:hypothetical protein